MEKKHYMVTYVTASGTPYNTAIDVHPLVFAKDAGHVVIFAMSITPEEYAEYKERTAHHER